MNWSFLVIAFYILLGIGAASGAVLVRGKIEWFEAVLLILCWPPILMGLIVIHLLEQPYFLERRKNERTK